MKNKTQTVDNGISLICRPVKRARINAPIVNGLILAVLSMITAISAVMTFATVLQLKIIPAVVIVATAGFCALFSVVYYIVTKCKWIVIIVAVLLSAIAFVIFKESIIKGTNILYYQGLETIYNYMYWDINFEPTYAFDDGFYSLTNGVLLILSFILCSASTYFIVVKPSFIATFLLTFPFFEIGAAFGAVPEYKYVYLMVASWTSILAYSLSTNAKIKIKKPSGKSFAVRMYKQNGRFAVTALSIAIITVILLSSTTSFLNAINFERTEDVDVLRKDIKYVATDVIDYITGKDNDGSLKEGNLLEVGKRIIKDRHYFYLETSMQEIEDHIKIKGYTATIYKDNKWQQTDEYDKYENLFKKLDGYSLRLGGINGNLLSNHKDYDKFNASKITLSDFRRKKYYAYEVYFSDFNSDYTTNMDTSMKPKSSSKYSYNAYLDYKYLFKITETGLYKSSQYQNCMKEYTEFVNDVYTESDATDSVKKLTKGLKAKNKYQLVDKIRQYFKENLKHKYNVTKCPEDEDFVENFLFNTQEGYSTHFATAAAVMLQSQGVPARYVEGYFIIKDDFNETESEHKYGYITFDVTDRYAHAWIEVYDEDFGWVPVEVTPGYWDEPFEDLMNRYKKPKVEEQPKEEEEIIESPEMPNDTEVDLEENNISSETQETTKVITINIGIVIIIIAGLILGLIVFIIVWIAMIFVLRFIRNKRLNSNKINLILNTAYKYYLRLAKFDGININNIYSYELYVNNAANISKHFDIVELKRFFEIMLKNTYSNELSTLDEATFVRNFVLGYSKTIYNDQKFFKKLSFKMVKIL